MAVGSFSLPISSGSTEWVRPSDWLPMPTGITSANQTFVGLYAVFPNGNNFASLLFTTSAGQYRVDWGDGTITLHNSNTIAQYEYNYATISNSTLTSRGYKQAMITVTPVSGNLLTFNLQQRFVSSPVQGAVYATGFLDCILSMPNASGGTSLVIGAVLGSLNVIHSYIERFEIKTIGNCTDLIGIFQGMYSLQSVPLFNTINVTRFQNMFQSCFLLRSVPLFNTQNASNMINMFNGCALLQSVPLFNTQSVTGMNGMFGACRSLVTIPLLNTQNVTNMDSMFNGCGALQSLPLLNTINVTNMSNMFNSCSALKTIPLFNTGNVTNMLNMFLNCASLQTVPLLNTSKVTSMSSMFQNCTSLNNIPAWSTALMGTFSNFSESCRSLDRIEMAFNQTVTIGNGQLSRTALVEIFTNLTNRTLTTSATINISGNWGAGALTAADRLIATSKNWVIVG
jgi:surface protein